MDDATVISYCNFIYFISTVQQRKPISLPVAKSWATKYVNKGLYTHLAVSTRWKEAQAETAKKSWSTCTTASRMLQRCAAEVGEIIDYPLTEINALTFVAWMINRGLSSSAMDS